MRLLAGLLCILAHAVTLNANVEKTIFLAPGPVTLPNVDADSSSPFTLDTLHLDELDPASRYILPTRLLVQFPTELAPRGLESWYQLHALDAGRRYEVRICWPATQPTDFWLDTFTLADIFHNPHLTQSIIHYNTTYPQVRRQLGLKQPDHRLLSPSHPPPLFLRIQAAASYFTTNQTLMREPAPVHVDIILDPFIVNILPRSLAPSAVYITLVSVFAWFASGFIYRWLISAASKVPLKTHTE